MNSLQVARQLRFLLQNRTWENSGGTNVVFANNAVRITQAISDIALSELRFPSALIRFGSGDHDEANPSLIRQLFTITVIQAVEGDIIGENALVGFNRPSSTSSQGRGLGEIEEEFFTALKELSSSSGIRIILRSQSDIIPATIKDIYIISRDYNFEVFCTTDRFYHPPLRLTATGGVGSVSLSWSLQPDRFDRREVILRRASGSTAPETPTSGTGVTLSGLLATSVVDSPLSAGTYSYSLFAGYDERNAGTSQRFSELTNDTKITVTVT